MIVLLVMSLMNNCVSFKSWKCHWLISTHKKLEAKTFRCEKFFVWFLQHIFLQSRLSIFSVSLDLSYCLSIALQAEVLNILKLITLKQSTNDSIEFFYKYLLIFSRKYAEYWLGSTMKRTLKIWKTKLYNKSYSKERIKQSQWRVTSQEYVR